MPADLTIVLVKVPSPLRAPCPVVLLVSVRNIGNDPPDRAPFDVTIDLGPGDAPGGRFQAIVALVEDLGRLSPGRTLIVPVRVQFPCTSPVNLRATVDLTQQVTNNLRSAPSLLLTGLSPTPVPWLVTSFQVSMIDSMGVAVSNPASLCTGKTVLAEITIDNLGCAASLPCTTEAVLEDARAVPSPVSLTTLSYPVPALQPGMRDVRILSFRTPNSAGGTSGFLGVHVKADVKADNPDQCDRTQLEARIVKPFGAGAPPRLALTLLGATGIRPGEVPALAWSVQNDCNEIGLADIRILFGTPPTELHRSQSGIPLQATTQRDLMPGDLTIPPAVASAFWTIGTKTITLEVTGTGPDPGPYQVSVPITVISESIDATWWTWGPSPTAFWKSTYGFTGSISNRGLAAMTPTVTALEHPTDVTGTAQDMTLSPAAVPGPVAPGASGTAGWTQRQVWQWLLPISFVETGPRSRVFSYVASFSVTDAFGNRYPVVSSTPLLITVSVGVLKIMNHGTGTAMMAVGLSMVVSAVVLLQLGYIGVIAAAVVASLGLLLIGGGTGFLALANDPPVPDFRAREPRLFDPRAWTIPEVEDERFHPLRTLALLVARVISAHVRAIHYRDRAWAAFLDRDDSARLRYRDQAREEVETLRRLVDACADAADEAQDQFIELLGRVESAPSVESVREMTGRFAGELHIGEREREILQGRLAVIDQEAPNVSLKRARADGLRNIGATVRNIYETTATAFAQVEYLQ